MPVAIAFRHIDAAERRHDGPVLPFDPAIGPDGAARERLFRRLAAEQRQALARYRQGLAAGAAARDPRLTRWQLDLAFYRREGAAWAARAAGINPGSGGTASWPGRR